MNSTSKNSEHPINFDNSYARLPQQFYTRQDPVGVSNPQPIRVNKTLARELGVNVEWLESDQGLQVIAGNKVPVGADPIATVYAGHQFGGWNPQLGDGRAILLGEVITPTQQRFDIQLKGSGPTPYSRGGDGRAPLGPILREYLVSEAMHVLGIPTSRVLAAATTGDPVYREETLPGAILIRIAASHIRIGTFEYFASQEDWEGLKLLINQVIQRHYPEASDQVNPILYMLQSVVRRQANLIADWQAVGFIHGVMNTDNMLLSGETIDYGPCAFMDYYDPKTVYSYIDRQGRYAYGNQPSIAHWNLLQLAQVICPLLDEDRERAIELAQEALNQYPAIFEDAYHQNMYEKIVLKTCQDDDKNLVEDLLALMAKNEMDFTLTFRRLADVITDKPGVADLIEVPEEMNPWIEQWRQRLEQEQTPLDAIRQAMNACNPIFIPRNHQVEHVIEQAVNNENFAPFHELVELLENPYVYDAQKRDFALPPKPDQVVANTFCGT